MTDNPIADDLAPWFDGLLTCAGHPTDDGGLRTCQAFLEVLDKSGYRIVPKPRAKTPMVVPLNELALRYGAELSKAIERGNKRLKDLERPRRDEEEE